MLQQEQEEEPEEEFQAFSPLFYGIRDVTVLLISAIVPAT